MPNPENEKRPFNTVEILVIAIAIGLFLVIGYQCVMNPASSDVEMFLHQH